MPTPASATIRDEIVRLAGLDLAFPEFARAGLGALRRAVPFDGAAAVAFDPGTALPVEAWTDSSPIADTDVAACRELAATGQRAAAVGDELRAVCVSDAGMWGALVLRRERRAPEFMVRDVDLLASLSSGFDEVQRARLDREVPADPDDRDRGLLLLHDNDAVELANAAASAWLEELGVNGRPLPVVVTGVAGRARAIAAGHGDEAATARVRAASGRWVLVSGSVLGSGADARTAVTLEPARPPEIVDLVADASGLTARERRVTELVARLFVDPDALTP